MGIFKDKIAIVTGSASGIGRAVSEGLAAAGARVLMADLNEKLLKEAVAAIVRSGFSAQAAPLDVREFSAVKKLVDDTVAERGRLDYLFNNAGISIMGEAQLFDYGDWKDLLEVNLIGVVNGVHAAYPIMVKQGFGHIVNTGSLAGLIPTPGEVSYVASKYAVVGLSNALRIEGRDLGVKVSVVCPGLIDTPIKDNNKLINMDRAKVMHLVPKMMPAQECAKIILRGVEKNQAIILVTGLTKLFWALQRISPALVRYIWLRNIRTFRDLVKPTSR